MPSKTINVFKIKQRRKLLSDNCREIEEYMILQGEKWYLHFNLQILEHINTSIIHNDMFFISNFCLDTSIAQKK